MHFGLKNTLTVRFSRRHENQTIVDKSPCDTYVISRIICFTTEDSQQWCFLFKTALLFPLPTQYNVESLNKSQVVVFNIISGGVKLGS